MQEMNSQELNSPRHEDKLEVEAGNIKQNIK